MITESNSFFCYGGTFDKECFIKSLEALVKSYGLAPKKPLKRNTGSVLKAKHGAGYSLCYALLNTGRAAKGQRAKEACHARRAERV